MISQVAGYSCIIQKQSGLLRVIVIGYLTKGYLFLGGVKLYCSIYVSPKNAELVPNQMLVQI